MKTVTSAVCFPPEQLESADLLKQRISEVTLGDIDGPGAGPSRAVVPSPGPWGLWATLGLGLLIAGAFAGTQIVVGRIVFDAMVWAPEHEKLLGDPNHMETNGLFLALTTCGAAPVGVGVTCLFAWLRRGISISDYLGLKCVPARELFRWCVALLALGVLSDGLSSLLGRPIVPNVVVDSYRTAWSPPLLWIAVVVLAPLNEEIFFRGFLFAGIRRSPLGGRGAVLLTTLLWSAIHLQYDYYGRATIFASGLLLGYARLKTDSLYPTLLMHGLMNLVATIQAAIWVRFVVGAN